MTDPAQIPVPVRLAPRAMATSVDQLASSAAVALVAAGGTAADAAVGANAVLSVTTQHQCGLGGDLLALVGRPEGTPEALVAVGRAGSGADPDRLRGEGAREMPWRGDVRSVTVPGCVDGWLALHARYGRLPLETVLAPAVRYASEGFPASPLLALRAAEVAELPGAEPFRGIATGTVVRRPGVARALAAIARTGRDGFYGGEFGEGLVAIGNGEFTADDLARPNAEWVAPIAASVWGATVWVTPAPSQGYLTLLGARIAEAVGLPDDPDDPEWAHRLVEAAKAAGHDRESVLYDGADVASLCSTEEVTRRAARIGARASAVTVPDAPGGTIHLNVVDRDGLAVSLTQSNAAGFGAFIVEPTTGVFLHNRGLGFSLRPGHPAEYGPGRRPPHTLSPALVTDGGGAVRMTLGTMGADSQPQVLLQLLARILVAGETPEDAVAAGRFVLAGGREDAFAVWRDAPAARVRLEGHAPAAWVDGLRERGHTVVVEERFAYAAGHAHVIQVGDVLRGAADPRVRTSDAVGL